MIRKKKILYGGIVILFVISIVGIILINSKPVDEEYNFPPPDEVVKQYFTSWSNKDYVNMYSTFSDGFKKIEATARTLQDFKEYAEFQNFNGVNVLNVKETSNDGLTASVDYDVEFVLNNGQKKPYKGTFTLKYKKGDIVQGWKLIHPYGDNIDNS